jgi:hypothetical protein
VDVFMPLPMPPFRFVLGRFFAPAVGIFMPGIFSILAGMVSICFGLAEEPMSSRHGWLF